MSNMQSSLAAPVGWFLRIYDHHRVSSIREKANLHGLVRDAREKGPKESVPLPPKRKRALTMPLPPPDLHTISGIRRARQRTADQSECLLLAKLPLEIRRIIYENVLVWESNKLLHILSKNGAIRHLRCRLQNSEVKCEAQVERCLEAWLVYKAKFPFWDKVGRLDVATDSGLLPLMLSCRTIYSEAIPVLYAKHIFHFYDAKDLCHFARSVVPQRLGDIQSIVLDWERSLSVFKRAETTPSMEEDDLRAWKECWQFIAKMDNLLDLKVVMNSYGVSLPTLRRERMVQPMMDICGLRTFDLLIPSNDRLPWDFVVNPPSPFRIIKGLAPGSTRNVG